MAFRRRPHGALILGLGLPADTAKTLRDRALDIILVKPRVGDQGLRTPKPGPEPSGRWWHADENRGAEDPPAESPAANARQRRRADAASRPGPGSSPAATLTEARTMRTVARPPGERIAMCRPQHQQPRPGRSRPRHGPAGGRSTRPSMNTASARASLFISARAEEYRFAQYIGTGARGRAGRLRSTIPMLLGANFTVPWCSRAYQCRQRRRPG